VSKRQNKLRFAKVMAPKKHTKTGKSLLLFYVKQTINITLKYAQNYIIIVY